MYLGKFQGCQEDNNGKVYHVIANIYDEDEAIREANKFFKIKSSKLKAERAYITDMNADEFSWVPYDKCFQIYAVSRK